MSLITGELSFPKKSYVSADDLFLPENKNARYVDLSCLNVDHKDVHKSVKDSKIVQFFNEKSVFLTGGTGFIGKLTTEKLLRTCEGIGYIYLLLRPKKGKDIQTRLDETFEDVVFSELKKKRPNFRCKIVPIEGDISKTDLGMSMDDRQILIENVNVIIHCAATVRFDEPLRYAAHVNVRGTKEVMTLAQQCKHLASLVHVSTAYSQCVNKEIREEFYEPPFKTEDFLRMIETTTDETLASNQKSIIKEWPNTYSFTKAIGEHTVRSMARNIPTAICRPSIVIPTFKEPIRGWTDNVYGPVGAGVAVGMGLMRTTYVDGEKHLDVIPGDITTNGIIAAAYQNQFNRDDIKIYNFVSTMENPISWYDFSIISVKYAEETPPIKTMWRMFLYVNKNKMVHSFMEVFLQFIPALLIDGILTLLGKKRRLVKIYRKLHHFILMVSFFSIREWKIYNLNTQKLFGSLTEKDKDIFGFSMNPNNFNWNDYLKIFQAGIRYYILKEDPDNVVEARKRYKRLLYMHITLRAVFILIVSSIVLYIVKNIIYSIFI